MDKPRNLTIKKTVEPVLMKGISPDQIKTGKGSMRFLQDRMPETREGMLARSERVQVLADRMDRHDMTGIQPLILLEVGEHTRFYTEKFLLSGLETYLAMCRTSPGAKRPDAWIYKVETADADHIAEITEGLFYEIFPPKELDGCIDMECIDCYGDGACDTATKAACGGSACAGKEYRRD